MLRSSLRLGVLLGALSLTLVPDASARSSNAHASRPVVSAGSATWTLPAAPLAALGFAVAEDRTTAGPTPDSYRLDLPAARNLELTLREGRFAGWREPVRLDVAGGLALRAWNPATGHALPPAFLYDATLQLATTAGGHVRVTVHATDPGVGAVLAATGPLRWDAASRELRLESADLTVTDGWARALDRPELAGTPLGTLDLVLATGDAGVPTPASSPTRGGLLDVKMAELYGLVQQGHIGTFPNGTAGLSAATTSCNVGEVDVPWFGTMNEDHPLIALAMYREEDGRLEMIGKNWIKHGFYSLNDSDCRACPNGAGGNVLRVDCSDTYTAANNGSQYYLGPREEVNPHTAAWTACGSFFDEPVSPDGDCDRDYFGVEPDDVSHRLTVADADLNRPGATYYYEGLYLVANDDFLPNNIGWRRLSGVTWNGTAWNLTTFNEDPLQPQDANANALVMTWGDQQERFQVADDDGLAMLSVDTTDLGDGWWRYDYALYNRTSARAIHSFSVPTGVAGLRNFEFRDIDGNAGNDWTLSTVGNSVTWSTDDWSTDPNANALEYQTLFNLRFEADLPPAAAVATGGLFRPGVGVAFTAPTLGPDGVVATPLPGGATGVRLALRGANPASSGFRLELDLPRSETVSLSVRDVTGRRVRELLAGTAGPGALSVRWDGRDSRGAQVASGVYFFRLETESGSRTVKGTLLR